VLTAKAKMLAHFYYETFRQFSCTAMFVYCSSMTYFPNVFIFSVSSKTTMTGSVKWHQCQAADLPRWRPLGSAVAETTERRPYIMLRYFLFSFQSRMRRGNAFGRVCLCVCPIRALTSESLDLETLFIGMHNI